jgi:hypothetical protein
MNEMVRYSEVQEKMLNIRGQHILLDSDVEELYGVETKRVNEAVRNNPDKFPEGYIFTLESGEMNVLRSNFSTLEMKMAAQGRGKYSKYNAKAFTEKGLYMLATILKSPRATQTTIAIVEAFAKLRELSRVVAELSEIPEKPRQKSLMQRSGDIMAELLGNGLEVTDAETSLEINLALMKFKHTVKQKSSPVSRAP